MNTTNAHDFPDGAALVIGGSGGIGQAICRELATRHCSTALTFHTNRTAASRMAEEMKQLHTDASVVQMSVTDLHSVQAAIDSVVTTYGRIHSIFVAAGSDIPQRYVDQVSPEEWYSVMRADADGFFNIVHVTLPHLRASGGGSYVHISSAGLLRWPPMDVLSVAPKASAHALIRAVAREEGRFNIRANSVALGVIETGIFLRLKESVFDTAWEKSALSTLALKRFGKPEEVANMAVFLASARAGYTTGQIIAVDGGFSI